MRSQTRRIIEEAEAEAQDLVLIPEPTEEEQGWVEAYYLDRAVNREWREWSDANPDKVRRY